MTHIIIGIGDKNNSNCRVYSLNEKARWKSDPNELEFRGVIINAYFRALNASIASVIFII